MTYYRLSPAAQADLDEIWDYTADKWNVDRANRYTVELRTACSEIAEGKRAGKSISNLRSGYMRLSVGSHYIFYRRADDVADIIRILHQRMDFERHLQ